MAKDFRAFFLELFGAMALAAAIMAIVLMDVHRGYCRDVLGQGYVCRESFIAGTIDQALQRHFLEP